MELSGFPAAELEFNRDAGLAGTADAVLALATDPATTDLLVLSHGWNNDMREARDLYAALTASLRAVAGSGAVPGLAGRRLAIAGVLWPSKKFADSELTAGGAATAGSPIDAAAIRAQLADLRGVFDDPAAGAILDAAAALVPELPDRATARAAFADHLRSLLTPDSAGPAAESADEDGSADLFAVSGATLMARLAIPVSLAPPGGVRTGVPAGARTGGASSLGLAPDGDGGPDGGANGAAAGLGSLFGGVWGAARSLANFVTYYAMKNRAGAVGERGLAPVLTGIQAARPDLRLHLAGHSFGGRLVAGAAKGVADRQGRPLASLSLLQAAFSHYGFAQNWDAGRDGYFRQVVSRQLVHGPTLITHTGNDKAVGIAYAIASRIAGQVAAAVGDAADRYGGIGRNGAQRTPEAVAATLLPVGGSYRWQPGRLHNLRADQFIASHLDVTGQQVGYAILSAICS
jgi:hypothetical protein